MPRPVAMPGPNLPDTARAGVEDVFSAADADGYLRTRPTVLAGGMEDMRSAYLLLDFAGQLVLLLERRNDDGEFAPLLFDAPAGLDPTDPAAVMRAVGAVGEYAQERDEADFFTDAATGAVMVVSDILQDALYGFRDTISPGALD